MYRKGLFASTITALLVLISIASVASLERSEANTDQEPIGTIRAPGYAAEVIHTTDLSPWRGQDGPNGEILLIGQYGDTVYQVVDDLELSVYASFPGFPLVAFDFDPEGHLWFGTDEAGAPIYRVDDDGTPQFVVEAHQNWFEIASTGDLFAIGHGTDHIRRITPAGQVSVFADGFVFLDDIAVGPNDEVVVLDEGAGQLIWVHADGEKTVILHGLVDYDNQFMPFFAPDGTLYVNIHDDGLYVVDIETGAKTPVTWFNQQVGLLNRSFFFQPRRFASYCQDWVIQVNLDTETADTIFVPRGNTTAMAVGPDSKPYVAYNNWMHGTAGMTWVYRIDPGDTLVEIGTITGTLSYAMAFAPDGTGYLSTATGGNGDRGLYAFHPGEPGFERITSQAGGRSVAVDPTTGYVWFAGWVCGGGGHTQGLCYMDDEGQISQVPIPDNVDRLYLAFGPDGTLYVMFFFTPPTPGAPLPHGIYRRETDGTWTELVDMTGEDPGIYWALPAVCPDETVYTLASVDGHVIEPGREWTCFNAILRLEEDGTLTVMGHDFPYDGYAIECDPSTGDLYFSHNQGVYRFYQWATDFIFLPVVLKAL